MLRMLFLLLMLLYLCICAPVTVLYVSVAMFVSMLTRVLITISTPGWPREDDVASMSRQYAV